MNSPKPPLPIPKAIIFDWDNTLVNTWPIIMDALNATFRDTGKPEWNFEETKRRVSKSMRDSFPEIFGADWQRPAELYQKHYRSRNLDQLQALPGAYRVLERVKELDLHCVVVSNKKGQNLRSEIKHIGWDNMFNAIVGADDAKRDKPHPEPVIMAFDKSHITPDAHVWFIGDSEIDLECAMNTGCTAILYGPIEHDHAGYTPTHFLGMPYHAHVRNHEETLRLLSFRA